MDGDPTDPPVARSVSQYQQYHQCPYAYYLARVERVWKRPAAWLPHGLAVHKAIEEASRNPEMSLAAAQDVFTDEYCRTVEKQIETTPNLLWWFPSGPYQGPEDIPRRYHLGLGQVEKFFDWRGNNPSERTWKTPTGEDGIELEFRVQFGDVTVVGVIDSVMVIDDVLVVRDVKTGNKPGDGLQLGVYATAIEACYGERPAVGEYWMAKTGKPTKRIDLSDWTNNRVTNMFGELDDLISREVFPPAPDADKCRICPVAYSCEFKI